MDIYIQGEGDGSFVNQLWAWLILNYEKYFSVNQQPILRLIDNCTNGTMPFPLDGFQYLLGTPVYKCQPLTLFKEFLPYRPL